MITKIKSLKSNHLDLTNITHKQLSIQFSLDGFSFCVFDLDLHEFIVFAEYSITGKNNNPKFLLENIKQIFNENKVLHETFSKINVIHVNNLATFVPKPLFKEENIANYIQFNNKIYPTDFFEFDSVINHDMYAVYVPYVHVNNFLIDQFGSFEYKHYSSILVEQLLNNYAQTNAEIVFVHVAQTHFEIIVSKNKKLRLYNTFAYKTKEDLIYYILFVMDQLKLDVENISIILLGAIQDKDALYEIIYKYIKNVEFLKYKTTYNSILAIDAAVKRNNFILFESIN